MGQAVGQVAVVGEHQQALGVDVEPADREDPGLAGHQVDDGRPALRIGGGGDDAGRLVEQVVDEAGANTTAAPRRRRPGRRPGVDPPTELGDLAVDRDPPGARSAPRTPAGCRSPTRASTFWSRSPRRPALGRLTRPGSTASLRPARRRVASARSVGAAHGSRPCSRASITSAPGTNSASGGSSSSESRPSLSRNSGVVPYSTAWPGPGSRPTSAM